jgi:hypothetical protein
VTPIVKVFFYFNYINWKPVQNCQRGSFFCEVLWSHSGVAEYLSVVGCYSVSTGTQYGRFEASSCPHLVG